MRDIYISSETVEEMISDLSAVGLSDGQDFSSGIDGVCFIYLGEVVETPAQYNEAGEELAPIVFLPGVYAALRFRTEPEWEAFTATSFPHGTHVVEKTSNMPVWA